MPHSVKKSGSGYAIVKRLPGGRTKIVGHSSSKRKAQASARIRDQKSKDR